MHVFPFFHVLDYYGGLLRRGVASPPIHPPGSIPVFGTPFPSVELSSSACYRKERWRLFAEE